MEETNISMGWVSRETWGSQHEGVWSQLCGAAGMACEIHLEIKSAGASLKLGHLVSPTRHPEMQIFNLGDALETQHREWQRSSHVREDCGHLGREKSFRISDTTLASCRFGEKGW